MRRRALAHPPRLHAALRRAAPSPLRAQILESAGFSKSNPYYIVAQGRVDALAKMSDAARLQVLKDVAGTQVFDDKRRESLRLLVESDAHRAQIAETLENIAKRLAELETEREALSAKQALTRPDRRQEVMLSFLAAVSTDEIRFAMWQE